MIYEVNQQGDKYKISRILVRDIYKKIGGEMTGLLIFVHSVCCILLIMVILMQSGRGGGLTESFASAESMFGAKTNEVMVRATVILATIFLATSLVLTHVSARRDRSLLDALGKSKVSKSVNVAVPLNALATNSVAGTTR